MCATNHSPLATIGRLRIQSEKLSTANNSNSTCRGFERTLLWLAKVRHESLNGPINGRKLSTKELQKSARWRCEMELEQDNKLSSSFPASSQEQLEAGKSSETDGHLPLVTGQGESFKLPPVSQCSADSVEDKNSKPNGKSVFVENNNKTTGQNGDRSNRASSSEPSQQQQQHEAKIKGARQASCSLAKRLVRRQLCSINSTMVNKLKLLFLLMNILSGMLCFVQAGFWTFYFPNFLKPSGYKELSDMIKQRQMEINSIEDNYADSKYFWQLLKGMNSNDTSNDAYPEESVCSDVFPLFTEMAIEYVELDYEYYMNPLQSHLNHLQKAQSDWFPEGEKAKNILPREWEQQLYEKDLTVQIEWREKLANNEEFGQKRFRLNELWRGIKRSLDTSLPCLYLRYAYRQISDDINQLALDMNVKALKGALEMVKSAYKRIDKYKESDKIAKDAINDSMKMKERFTIKL